MPLRSLPAVSTCLCTIRFLEAQVRASSFAKSLSFSYLHVATMAGIRTLRTCLFILHLALLNCCMHIAYSLGGSLSSVAGGVILTKLGEYKVCLEAISEGHLA